MTTERLPKIVLAILGVWGLLAGLMLIHTLLATKQLHHRVTAITHTVSQIDQETGSIELMRETNRISAALLAASRPLPGTLQDMNGVTAGLAHKVDSILAGSTTIQNNSQAIEGKVVAARDTAAGISGSVKGIGQSLADILAALRATQTAAGEINASTRGINASVAALLPVTQQIDAGIGGTNQGIAPAVPIVNAIRADIENILSGMPDVQKHAESIDCHSKLGLLGVLSGPGEACS